MNELVNLIVKKTGIPAATAQTIVNIVLDFLKKKLPAPVARTNRWPSEQSMTMSRRLKVYLATYHPCSEKRNNKIPPASCWFQTSGGSPFHHMNNGFLYREELFVEHSINQIHLERRIK